MRFSEIIYPEMNGVVFGLGAAALQSASYLMSRNFFSRHRGSPWLLLTISHAIMGIMSLVALPWVYPADMQWNRDVILGVMGAGGFYLVGQQAMFIALRHIDASRLAPLLGAKILFLAFVTTVFGGARLSGSQWIAVLLSMVGIHVLNEAGGRLPWRGLVSLSVAIACYSLSDLSIIRLVHGIGLDNLRGSLFGAILTYLMCGLLMAPFLLKQPAASKPAVWRSAALYSVVWFVAMVLLYACFAEIGAVFGNIVQSTRGLISIMMGIMISKMGYVWIEKRTGRWTVLKRVLGALAMMAAIALYMYG